MNLLSLKQNFQTLPTNEQFVFLDNYVKQRVIDLEKTVIVKTKAVKRKGAKATKEKKIPVTLEQLELLRKLKLI